MRGRKNTNTSCLVRGCSEKPRTRGYCSAHYRRWLRHGSPLAGRTSHHAPEQWLRLHADHKDEECLIWPFAKTKKGYAIVRTDESKSPQSASRIMCSIVNGCPPEPWYEAAHSCGNGAHGCVNPGHLRWATPVENRSDKIRHGTATCGSKNHQSKLTEEDVRQIRSMKGLIVQQRLAEKYGVANSVISRIQNGRDWAWLDQESA